MNLTCENMLAERCPRKSETELEGMRAGTYGQMTPDKNKTKPTDSQKGSKRNSSSSSQNNTRDYQKVSLHIGSEIGTKMCCYLFFSCRDGHFGHASCSHTLPGTTTRPWWQVDLGTIYTIRQVSLYNRADCCGKYVSC